MTQKLSRKNHYISQFHIKMFYDKDENLCFYDKEMNTFYTNVAQNAFYKKNMNVVSINGKESDEIEKIQAELEGIIKNEMATFQQFIESDNISQRYDANFFESIIWFAYFTFWRNPQNDSLYDRIKDNINFDLVLKISNKYYTIKTQIDENDEFGNLWKRTLLPYVIIDDKDVIKRIVKYSKIIGTEQSSLLNDYPLLCNDVTNFTKTIGNVKFNITDFIFPLSKNLTFVYSENIAWNEIDSLLNGNSIEGITIEMFTNFFSYFRDASLFVNAERFVCCEDEKRLKEIKQISGKETFMFHFLKYYKEYIKHKQNKDYARL